jgi:hypothetical protein
LAIVVSDVAAADAAPGAIAAAALPTSGCADRDAGRIAGGACSVVAADSFLPMTNRSPAGLGVIVFAVAAGGVGSVRALFGGGDAGAFDVRAASRLGIAAISVSGIRSISWIAAASSSAPSSEFPAS